MHKFIGITNLAEDNFKTISYPPVLMANGFRQIFMVFNDPRETDTILQSHNCILVVTSGWWLAT